MHTFFNDESYFRYFAQIQDPSIKVIRKDKQVQEITSSWVDIFPLDGMPNNRLIRTIHKYYVLWRRAAYRFSRFSTGVDFSKTKRPLPERILIAVGRILPVEKIFNTKKELIKEAVMPFMKPEVREYVENIRRSHEQIIDNVNLDEVLFAGFDVKQKEDADRVLQNFHAFIEENKDEIIAMRIIYDQQYKDRPMAITQMKKLYEKLKAQGITIERLWDCYAIKKKNKVKGGTMGQLADLISIIRFEMGYADNLTPFADKVNYNFMQWTLRRNAGAVHFTNEQMEWLRLIKDHIATSLSIEPGDLELSPFDHKGGLGRFYEVFGESYEEILMEMNIELVA